MRNRWLEGIEAIIQQQQRMPPERDDHCFLRFRKNGRTRLFRPSFKVFDRRTLAIIRAIPRTNGGPALIIVALTACVAVALP